MGPEPLLSYLDARVRQAAVPNRLRGTLCVGVRRGGQTSWWIGAFGPNGCTQHFADELPARFDAAVAMDTATALWVVGARGEQGELHIKTGDAKLLNAFTTTYLSPSDPLSWRLRGGRAGGAA